MKICCNKCQSEHIRSIDNESLFHPTKDEVTSGMPNYDNELYMKFVCDDCDKIFTIVFSLTPKI